MQKLSKILDIHDISKLFDKLWKKVFLKMYFNNFFHKTFSLDFLEWLSAFYS